MVEIRKSAMGENVKEFLSVVDYIYRDDPHFVRPLDMELKQRLDPKKNPFFEHGEGVLFTAHRNGKCVGRASAQIDREHLERYRDETGFFGFLDTVDDEEVVRELLAKCEDWLRQKGMKRVRGPLSLNTNEEMGCLVEGFDTPPYVMMPHHRSYQGALIEKAGYTKAKDVYAWKYVVGELNARTRKAHEEIKNLPEVSSRLLSLKDMDRDLQIIIEIFNDAWADNWGFVPLTKSEVKKLADDFKMIIVPEITRIVSIDGEPAAFAVAIPNLNEMIKDLRGRLFPTGILKVLYRLKVEGPKTGRLVFLGIKKKYRNVKKYGGLSAFMFAEMNDSGKKLGIKSGELSWTLEDNGPVNAAIRLMGAQIYKRYRIFEKSLVSEREAAKSKS